MRYESARLTGFSSAEKTARRGTRAPAAMPGRSFSRRERPPSLYPFRAVRVNTGGDCITGKKMLSFYTGRERFSGVLPDMAGAAPLSVLPAIRQRGRR